MKPWPNTASRWSQPPTRDSVWREALGLPCVSSAVAQLLSVRPHDITLIMNTHKYSKIAERLCKTGGLLSIIRYLVITNAPAWIFDMAWLMILAGLGFALAGQIARRREQAAKHQVELA